MTKVITHQGRTDRVDLCKQHSADPDVVRKHLGAEYTGVYHGLHFGDCAECLASTEALPFGVYNVSYRRGDHWLKDYDPDVRRPYLARLARDGVGAGVTAVAERVSDNRRVFELSERGMWREVGT